MILVVFGVTTAGTTSLMGAAIGYITGNQISGNGTVSATTYDNNNDFNMIPTTALPDGTAIDVTRMTYVTGATTAAPIYLGLYARVTYSSGSYTVKPASSITCVRIG